MAPRQRKSNMMLGLKLSIVLMGGWVIASFASVEQPSSSKLIEINAKVSHHESELAKHSERLEHLEKTVNVVN